MPIGLQFPFQFDVESLHRDLGTAMALNWTRHYNEQDYGGMWSGIALRSASGRTDDLVAAPPGEPGFRDTELLARCPYFREVLKTFQCPLKAVRLLSLAPQSFIREHSDYAPGYDDREIRIHVPIQTNPNVEFYVAGERLLLEEGHSYFVNVNLPHRVNNRGQAHRIHLVIDATVNEWVHDLFRRGEAECWDIERSERPPGNVDDFRRLVLTDVELRVKLEQIGTWSQLANMALETGKERGFDFHEGDIDATKRCAPLVVSSTPPAGWVPTAVSYPAGKPVVDWIYAGVRRFSEPFFDDSVKAVRRVPFSRFMRLQSPLARIRNEDVDTLTPSGFIFHVSRCGSTLVSRMLGAVPGTMTISEAPPLDQVLQAPLQVGTLTEQEHVEWLRGIVTALGRRRAGSETHLFIKMDAWHNHRMDLLRTAFPGAPWVFLYRDPVEVMVSQLSQPGLLSLPGAVDPRFFELADADITRYSREAWLARVLEGIYASGLRAHEDPKCLFVDYCELPEAVCGRIATHFGIEVTPDERTAMRSAAVVHAKNPGIPFERDVDAKQAHATDAIRQLCEGKLNTLYAEMRRRSKLQQPSAQTNGRDAA